MYRFIIGKRFLKAVSKVDNKSSNHIWKSLTLLERNPPPKGLNVEKIKSNKDLESCRLSKGIRVIFFRNAKKSLIELLFVGNHDDAYNFASSFNTSHCELAEPKPIYNKPEGFFSKVTNEPHIPHIPKKKQSLWALLVSLFKPQRKVLVSSRNVNYSAKEITKALF